MQSSYETITLDRPAPHVLQVTLARPEAANALNTQMGRDLLGLWASLTEDAADVRCIVLTGQGDSVFCAGGDGRRQGALQSGAVGRSHRERTGTLAAHGRPRSVRRQLDLELPQPVQPEGAL